MERLTEWVGNGPNRKAIARQDYPDIGDKDCVARLAAYEDTGLCPETAAQLKEIVRIFNCAPGDPAQLRWLCDKLRGWQQAEKDGRLVVLPGGDNDAVLAAVFRGEKPVVMHGGGDIDDLIALTHVLVSYAAETLGAGYTDFCWRIGEMPPTTDFKPAKEAEAAVEKGADTT